MKRGITVEKRSAVISFCFPCAKNETRFSSVTHGKQQKAKVYTYPIFIQDICNLNIERPTRKNFCIFSRRRLSHIRFDVHRPCVVAQHFLQNGFNAAGILWYNTAEVFPERFTEAFNERLQTTISYDGSNDLSDCRNQRTRRSYYCPPRRHDQPASEA